MSLSARAWLWIAVALAAAVRLPTLDLQSLWADEAVTASVTSGTLGHLFSAVWNGESTPPLFYMLEWPVVALLGDGEAALRLVPAACSIAAVPVVAAIARRITHPSSRDWAGAAAALLCAANPLLIWFGQEARAYALLALLSACTTLLVLRATEAPTQTRLGAWAASAILAFATHWFAIFVLLPQAFLLAWRLRRTAAPPLAALGAGLAAGLPLLLHQRSQGLASFIDDRSIGGRLAEIPKQFLVGYDAPLEALLTTLAALLVLAGVAGVMRTRNVQMLAVAAIAAGGAALPLLAAVAGQDYLLTRNLLPALILLIPLLGAGLATLGRPGAGAVGGLAAVGIAITIAVAADSSYQRDDWRSAVESLGPPGGRRLVIVTPASGLPAAEYYLRDTTPLSGPTPVWRTAIIAVGSRDPGRRRAQPAVPPSPPGTFPTQHSGKTWLSMQTAHGLGVAVPATASTFGGPKAAGLVEG